MDKLQHIIKELKSYEIKLIRNLYRLKTSCVSKRLELFNLCVTERKVSDSEASRQIYGQPPDSKFSQLKKRLKDDILNVLLVQSSSSLDGHDPVMADITSRKFLLQGKILMQRGMREEAVELLKKSLQIAERYEIMDIKIMIYDLLRSETPDFQPELIKIYTQKIAVGLSDQKVMLEAEAVHYALICKKDLADLKSLETTFENLRYSCRNSSSKKTEWWYTMAELQFYKDTKAYRKAYNNGRKLLKLLRLYPQLSTPTIRKKILTEIGRLSIYIGEFDQAIDYAREALNHYEKDDIEILSTLEIIYIGFLKTVKPEKAISVANNALKSAQKYEGMHIKWIYYLAQLKFGMERFSESIALLNSKYATSKNHPQLTFGVRTLDLLNTIELNEYGWVDLKLDSYRKLLQRNKNHSKVYLYRAIYQVLSALSRCNFDFPVTKKSEYQTLTRLKELNNGNCHWDVYGYELINFSDWFNTKLTGQKNLSLLAPSN